MRTAAPVPLAKLDRLPDGKGASGPYLCLALRRAGGRASGGSASAAPNRGGGSGWSWSTAPGKATAKTRSAARVKRPSAGKLVVSLLPAGAGLTPRRYRWRVLESQGGCAPVAHASAASCQESLPASGFRAFRLRPVRAVGCTGGSAGLDTNGPRERKVVALTFDDGPSEYTPGFLEVLREKHVNGTFFEIGQEMPGREATMRQILAEGNEIGDHTMHHVEYPGYSRDRRRRRPDRGLHPLQALPLPPARRRRRLRRHLHRRQPRDADDHLGRRPDATGRPPAPARSTANIVDDAQPGSIILMHDGGGHRSETLAALPQIIDTLRARGYSFETVTQLLGYRLIYQPYG